MKALLIVGGFLLLLLLLLWIPVSVRFSWREGQIRASVHYLLLRLLDFSPEQEAKTASRKAKKAVKKQDKKEVRKEREKKKEGARARGTADTMRLLWQLLLDSRRPLNRIRRGVVFYRIKVYGCVVREDAHQTAVTYGRICALMQTGLGVFSQLFRLQEPEVYLAPDFTGLKSRWDISFRVRIRPLVVLAAGTGLLLKAALTVNRHRPKGPRGKKKQQEKDRRVSSAA